MKSETAPKVTAVLLPLDRDVFPRTLLWHLAGTLQDVVGINEASGFISVVDQKIGEEINQAYRQALSVDHLNRGQVTGCWLT